jgi:hypothetical protein
MISTLKEERTLQFFRNKLDTTEDFGWNNLERHQEEGWILWEPFIRMEIGMTLLLMTLPNGESCDQCKTFMFCLLDAVCQSVSLS